MTPEQVAEAHKLDAELRENIRSQPRHAKDFKQLRQAAEQGNGEAQNKLRQAAEQGDAEAQYNLGLIYGREMPKSG